MDKEISKITLDLQDAVSPVMIDIPKGDNYRSVRVVFRNGGLPFALDECTATVNVFLPNGQYHTGSCTLDDDAVIFDIVADVTAVAGVAACELVLSDASEHQITSPKFFLRINPVIDPS